MTDLPTTTTEAEPLPGPLNLDVLEAFTRLVGSAVVAVQMAGADAPTADVFMLALRTGANGYAKGRPEWSEADLTWLFGLVECVPEMITLATAMTEGVTGSPGADRVQ